MAITIPNKDQPNGTPNHLPGHLITCAQPVPVSQFHAEVHCYQQCGVLVPHMEDRWRDMPQGIVHILPCTIHIKLGDCIDQNP